MQAGVADKNPMKELYRLRKIFFLQSQLTAQEIKIIGVNPFGRYSQQYMAGIGKAVLS